LPTNLPLPLKLLLFLPLLPLLPLLLLFLALPVLIAAAAATGPLLSVPLDATGWGKWLAVLGLYDLVFALLAYALFDFLMED